MAVELGTLVRRILLGDREAESLTRQLEDCLADDESPAVIETLAEQVTDIIRNTESIREECLLEPQQFTRRCGRLLDLVSIHTFDLRRRLIAANVAKLESLVSGEAARASLRIAEALIEMGAADRAEEELPGLPAQAGACLCRGVTAGEVAVFETIDFSQIGEVIELAVNRQTWEQFLRFAGIDVDLDVFLPPLRRTAHTIREAPPGPDKDRVLDLLGIQDPDTCVELSRDQIAAAVAADPQFGSVLRALTGLDIEWLLVEEAFAEMRRSWTAADRESLDLLELGWRTGHLHDCCLMYGPALAEALGKNAASGVRELEAELRAALVRGGSLPLHALGQREVFLPGLWSEPAVGAASLDGQDGDEWQRRVRGLRARYLNEMTSKATGIGQLLVYAVRLQLEGRGDADRFLVSIGLGNRRASELEQAFYRGELSPFQLGFADELNSVYESIFLGVPNTTAKAVDELLEPLVGPAAQFCHQRLRHRLQATSARYLNDYVRDALVRYHRFAPPDWELYCAERVDNLISAFAHGGVSTFERIRPDNLIRALRSTSAGSYLQPDPVLRNKAVAALANEHHAAIRDRCGEKAQRNPHSRLQVALRLLAQPDGRQEVLRTYDVSDTELDELTEDFLSGAVDRLGELLQPIAPQIRWISPDPLTHDLVKELPMAERLRRWRRRYLTRSKVTLAGMLLIITGYVAYHKVYASWPEPGPYPSPNKKASQPLTPIETGGSPFHDWRWFRVDTPLVAIGSSDPLRTPQVRYLRPRPVSVAEFEWLLPWRRISRTPTTTASTVSRLPDNLQPASNLSVDDARSWCERLQYVFRRERYQSSDVIEGVQTLTICRVSWDSLTPDMRATIRGGLNSALRLDDDALKGWLWIGLRREGSP